MTVIIKIMNIAKAKKGKRVLYDQILRLGLSIKAFRFFSEFLTPTSPYSVVFYIYPVTSTPSPQHCRRILWTVHALLKGIFSKKTTYIDLVFVDKSDPLFWICFVQDNTSNNSNTKFSDMYVTKFHD